jgi:hypothetical protein
MLTAAQRQTISVVLLFIALVMFVFMLIATTTTDTTLFTVSWTTWLASGLVAWILAKFFKIPVVTGRGATPA